MQKNRWSRKFDWIEVPGDSGTTYVQQTRSVKYDEDKFIAVGDIYFKLNKYLTGVTFTYINSLNDIYKRDLLTGDGYSIVNMYNEYDVVDRVLKNIVIADVAADTNIPLTSGGTPTQWYEINGVKLKPKHLVLLMNQTSEFENDIYEVTNQYFLKNAGFLSTREKSDKFSCNIKMGKNADKQFFLINNGDTFPITSEPKYFIEGKSYMLKNLIKYNIYNTSTGSTTAKIVFTDFDVARKQLEENYGLYNEFYLSGITLSGSSVSSYLKINYHHDSYVIRTGNTSDIIFTGITSDITNIYSGCTSIIYTVGFDCYVGDYICLNIYSGSTSILSMSTFIKNIQDGRIYLEENIPNDILTKLKNCSFSVQNLNAAYDWSDAINKFSNYTPYIDFYTLINKTVSGITDLKIYPKECAYDKYFDYDGLTFNFDDDTIFRYFYTDYQYIKYKLYNNLDLIDSTGFTSSFKFFNEYLLNVTDFSYTDSNRIIITTSLTGMTDIFKPYTYVSASGYSSSPGDEPTQKSLVYSVKDHEIIIEKPASWIVKPTVTSIQNIDGLKAISDILYEVYMNDAFDWYIQKPDNERKYITRTYAYLLTLNDFFRRNVTGILYENRNNEFILKLYDIENDKNLYFSAIELVFLGADRKSRLPVPLKLIERERSAEDSTFMLNWNVLVDGYDDSLDGIGPSGIVGDVFESGIDNVVPGPEGPPLLYNIIDGGVDSV